MRTEHGTDRDDAWRRIWDDPDELLSPAKRAEGEEALTEEPPAPVLVFVASESADTSAPPLVVLNGNGALGVGEEVARLLVPEGFRIVTSGNAETFDLEKTRSWHRRRTTSTRRAWPGGCWEPARCSSVVRPAGSGM